MEVKTEHTSISCENKKSGISYLNGFIEKTHENYNFKTLKLAPVYKPTIEEFESGPLNYIKKIRNEAEKYGICRIIPPSNFQPPFTVDVDNFRFTPRVQRLNELEAQTRVRLSFLEHLFKYWDLQGQQIKIPSINKKILDLYLLHKVVANEGGFETCVKDRKWSVVANKMGFYCTPQNKGTIASLLRHHYEKILFPYDLFSVGATYDQESFKDINNVSSFNNSFIKQENIENDLNNKQETKINVENDSVDNNLSDQSDKTQAPISKDDERLSQRTSKRLQGQSLCNVKIQNKELARLQVYGPGPKMPGFSSAEEEINMKNKNNLNLSLPKCVQCSDSQNPSQLISCYTCKNNFHLKCLIPPLNEIPKSIWNCPRCIAFLVQTQPQSYIQEFGFVQSPRNYSLTEFGEIADQFKTDYFKMPCHAVPLELAEKEFWRLVSSFEDSVAVEYGADLHTNDFGSGFPTRKNSKLLSSDLEYVDHPWNLNNLPVLEGSVFKYINTNISGMIVPWMYVGMCFSTFCWHNEDHWSYSINYLHWGEVKTWYGVPGSEADKFEEAMKGVASELFKSQPDLLHQLVTICNPNVLESYGVPIYCTNQHAGEFVVTFPRAYHAGFNHGLNFAEAVNFSPADWLPLGRECMNHYSTLQRYPVFSHDELVCKMANDPDILDISIAEATYSDLLVMVEQEKSARENVLQLGVMKTVRETFELLPDDERQCDYCKTTCFLSGLSCDCSDCKLVCLKHADKLCKNCKFEMMTLRYRYTLDELPLMLNKMENRKAQFKNWLEKVDIFFSIEPKNQKFSLLDLENHLNEVKIKNFPKNNEKIKNFEELVNNANKLSKVCNDIISQQSEIDSLNEVKFKNKSNQDSKKNYLKQFLKNKEIKEKTLPSPLKTKKNSKKSKDQENDIFDYENTKLDFSDFVSFVEEINFLPCTLPKQESLQQLYNRCSTIKKSLDEIANNTKEDSDQYTSNFIEQLIYEANSISIIDFDQGLETVKYKLDEINWIEKTKVLLNFSEDNRKKKNQVELSAIESLIESSHNLFVSSNTSRKLALEIQSLKDQADHWIEKAKILIDLPEKIKISNTDFDLNTYSKLPSFKQIQDLIKEAEDNSSLMKLNLNSYLEKLQKIVFNAESWIRDYEEIFFCKQENKEENMPFFDQIEELFLSAKTLGCKVEPMNKISPIYTTFKNWREKLQKLILRKNSFYSLFSVILPRTKNSLPSSVDLVNTSSKVLYQQIKKFYLQQGNKDQSKIDWFKKTLDKQLTRLSIEKAYKEAVLNEEVCMKEIREKNLIKLHSSTNIPDITITDKITDIETEEDTCERIFDIRKKKFCICGKKPSDWMIQCQLCQDWFHISCLQLYLQSINSPFSKLKKTIQQISNESGPNFDGEHSFFLCILCSRSKRPSLESLINLSEQISNQKIRIMENEILRCLVARAKLFKNKLQKELNSRSDLNEAYTSVVKAFNKSTSSLLDTSSEKETAPLKKKRNTQSFINIFNKPKLDLEITLTDQTKNVLYNLIWDCSLLQININELKYLWEIWVLSNPSNKTAAFIASDTVSLPVLSSYFSYKQDLKSTDTIQKSKELINDNKKRKIDSCSKLNKSNSVEKIKQDKKQKIKKFNLAETNKQEKNTVKKINLSLSSNSSSSEAEVCILKEKCLRPINEEVDWIFCEGECQGWYHQLCAGLNSSSEINEIDKFFCFNCISSKKSIKTCAMNEKCFLPNSDKVNWIFCDGICKSWYHQTCVGIEKNNDVKLEESFYCSKCKSIDRQNCSKIELPKMDSQVIEKKDDVQENIEAAKSILCLGREIEQPLP